MAKQDKAQQNGTGKSHHGSDSSTPIPPYDTRDHWENWRLQTWATREAKKKDKPYKKQEPWKRRVQALKRLHEEDPELYSSHFAKYQAKVKDSFMNDIESGGIIEARQSGNPEFVKFQRMINRMARRCGFFKKAPKLVIHLPDPEQPVASDGALDACVMVEGYISTNLFTAQYGVQHPEIFKLLMAHEMAHLANGDQTVETLLLDNRIPPNQKQEILADRLAAIIHGNPKEYAKHTAELLFLMKKMAGERKCYSSMTNLSANGNARMLHKWADMLSEYRWSEEGHKWNDGRGATDEQGNVIMEPDENGHMMPLRALAIFERSREFTEAYLNTALDFGVPDPVPTPRGSRNGR
jgi:hypothetical protein